MRLTSTGLTLLAAAAAALAVASTASAHARPKSSAPAKGEVLAASPSQVTVVFTQAIQKVAGTYSLEVQQGGGASITSGPAMIAEDDRSRMSVSLQGGLAPGRYVVHWTNISDEDGDAAEGAFSFYIQTQPSAGDQANDRQLESVGAEPEATIAADTPAAGGTASATAAAPTRTSATPAAAAEPDDGGDGNTTLYVAIGLIAAVAVLGAGGFAYARRRAGR